MTPPRGLLWALALAGCAQRVLPRDLDAQSADAPAEAGADAVDATRVRTCSELRLRAVSASPGREGAAYPGSLLTLRGTDLDVVDRVSVGGVEMPFERAGDALTTRVPPMLAVGPQAVVAANERCSASLTLTVSRLLARIPRAAGPVALLDWQIGRAHV